MRPIPSRGTGGTRAGLYLLSVLQSGNLKKILNWLYMNHEWVVDFMDSLFFMDKNAFIRLLLIVSGISLSPSVHQEFLLESVQKNRAV